MPRHRLLVMTRLQIVFLVVLLPLCSAQFSIQGPSDGSRKAQGLKYSQEKGIEYEDQRASLGAGDFSIQGASDGNSNFQIQGASDGNSDFQIQGATDGNANFQIQGATDGNANFQIQGATDSNANFRIQGPTDANVNYQVQGASAGHHQQQSVIQRPAYDANERGGGRALQYRDPSGLSVNWKSYQQAAPQHPQQIQQEQQQQPLHNTFIPHDAIPQPAPRRHRPAHRQQQHQVQQQQQPLEPEEQPVARPNYKPYDNAPAQIKQLLQFQQQIPYLNIIPQQYRYDAINGQEQGQQGGGEPEYQQPQRPREKARAEPDAQNQYRSQYRGKPRGQSRNKRQISQQRQTRQQPQHRQTQPPVEAQPQYSTNVPSGIQNILKFQAQIPYVNHIPEKWRYDALAAGQNFKQEFRTQQQNYAPPAQNQGGHRQRREAQQQSQIRQYRQHQPARQHQPQQQQQQPQYQRIAQPPVESQPQYSTNVPSGIQNILKFQAQAPYVNHIPEKWRYDALAAGKNFRQEYLQQQSYVSPQQNHQQQQRPLTQDQGQHSRQKRHAQQSHIPQRQPQQQQPQYQRIAQPPAEPQPHYSTNVPAHLQNLLKFQAQAPYTSVIPEKFRYENLAAAQGQHRQRRQAPQYQQPQQSQHQQQPNLQQYQRISQPPAEPQPQYSTNVPDPIKKLLAFQSQTPYNVIANQIIYRPDKPYVPQPTQHQQQQQQQQPQYQQPQPQYQQPQPQYQRPQPQYQQPQPQYQQPQPQYQQPQPQYQQPQPQYQQHQQAAPQSAYQSQGQVNYGQPQGVRPVTERQY